MIRCNTPQQMATKEKELQESLHNCRMEVVLARRQLLASEKKSNVIEQRIHKERKLTDNKKQVRLLIISHSHSILLQFLVLFIGAVWEFSGFSNLKCKLM